METIITNRETVVEDGVTITRWIASGRTIRRSDCDACNGWSKTGPEHEASPLCRSGRSDHCSCDGCY